MLAQKDMEQSFCKRKNNLLHVVEYYSRRTADAESRYHSYELETLAVVRAVEHFRHYLYGRRFVVVTDCNSLKASKIKERPYTPRLPMVGLSTSLRFRYYLPRRK